MFLDGFQHLFVNRFLVGLAGISNLVFFLFGCENVSSFGLLGLGSLGVLEIIIIDVFGQLDGRNIHASLGSQKVTLVDSSHGTTVQFQGSGDKDESGCQLFEDNNTLSLVSSSKNDSNGSTSQRGSQSSLLLGEKFGGSTLGSLVHGRNVISQSLDTNHTLSSVLGSIDLLFNKGRCGLDGLLGSLLLDELVDGLLVVSLGLTETVHSALQSVISGHTNVLIFRCHRRFYFDTKGRKAPC